MNNIAKEEAYRLIHEGSLALSQIESNGIMIDLDFLSKTIKKVESDIADIEQQMRSDPIYRLWHKTYGEETNLSSRDQLGLIIFNKLKNPCKSWTATGKYQTDEKSFSHLEIPFVSLFFKKEKLKKLNGTYLKNLLDETIDGYLHPVFNLHTVQTYRSSSSAPNFQNIPIRNPDIAKYLRPCFIPRSKDRQLVEIDYSGIEVRIAACYHKDPVMLNYIKDPSKDMHRDMAMELFILKKSEVSKNARYAAKNMFVFPAFYGSYYVECSKNLWESMTALKLEVDGKPMKTHLKEKGIRKRGSCDPESPAVQGTFEYHVKNVEYNFWNRRFQVYAEWKKQWYEQYVENNGFYTYTGFWIGGDLSRNEVINFPVQGPAFHCLLQSLIWIQKAINKRGMKTKIVGQIHDSIIADVPCDELESYIKLAKFIMTKKLLKHWKWIIVPLDIEVEVSPPGESWYKKSAYKI